MTWIAVTKGKLTCPKDSTAKTTDDCFKCRHVAGFECTDNTKIACGFVPMSEQTMQALQKKLE